MKGTRAASRRAACAFLAATAAVALSSSEAAATRPLDLENPEAGVEGGLGVSWIDGDPYWNLQLRPEVAFGKLGVGLNFDLLVNTGSGKIRHEDLEIEKIIRYVRWGMPNDPLYGRVGALDHTTLGQGLIVYRYANQVVENQRKLGLEFGLHRDLYDVQAFTNNLGALDLYGTRVAVAPLRERISTPVVNRIRIGASWVRDDDEDQKDANGDQSVTAIGLDAELPLIRTGIFSSSLYAGWARLLDHGSGRSAGIGAELPSLMGVLDLAVLLERRWNGDEFLPRYFDYFYEQERYDPASGIRKSQTLDAIESNREIAGELAATVLGAVRVRGLYEVPDEKPRLGRLHLDASFPTLGGIEVSGTYDRKGVENGGDLFGLDERSLLAARFSYPLNSWARLAILYEWTYHYDDATDEYRTIEKVTPTILVGFRL
jgi:hypothetical protein